MNESLLHLGVAFVVFSEEYVFPLWSTCPDVGRIYVIGFLIRFSALSKGKNYLKTELKGAKILRKN